MLMPFHMITFSMFFTIYALIIYKMRKSSDNIVMVKNRSSEIRVTKTVLYVVLTYVIFVMPFFVCELSAPFEDSSKEMRYFGRFLLLCSTAVNPFIYFFRVSHVKEKAAKLQEIFMLTNYFIKAQ